MLKVLKRVFNILYPDRRSEREKAREREFILAANSLKTLKVTPEGGMSIDPDELRDQIIASREQLKHLVHRRESPSRLVIAAGDAQVEPLMSPTAEAPVSSMDCIEVVAWRRLHSGAAVRYVCLQATSTGRFAVMTASLYSGCTHSLPSWIEANTAKHVANAIQNDHLRWLATVSEAMDAWDADL
ncbi:hypothetical protein [Pseudomonas brassicacearum]|uniref:Uncharacterized protein n=1 Tax=Pseudomonas brassicacearum subsp. neoaurantiaca TaxID=494916 RepID=A0A7V8UBH1_9PSED|nr:hypothetical protein [Pseudomonas brassicacearum]MBA1376658.1 hypothetical protein [Pseudomonas brassicacearum subsp. neoaurantiaca]